MSTTFAVKVPYPYNNKEFEEIEVAYRSNGIIWTNPLAHLLPDNLKVIATDNTPQKIYTIGDIKKTIDKENSKIIN